MGADNAYTPALTRRREPALPVTRTRRLMRRLTAQHGVARLERDGYARQSKDNPSGVYIFYMERVNDDFSFEV